LFDYINLRFNVAQRLPLLLNSSKKKKGLNNSYFLQTFRLRMDFRTFRFRTGFPDITADYQRSLKITEEGHTPSSDENLGELEEGMSAIIRDLKGKEQTSVINQLGPHLYGTLNTYHITDCTLSLFVEEYGFNPTRITQVEVGITPGDTEPGQKLVERVEELFDQFEQVSPSS